MQWWHPLVWEKLWQDYASVDTGVAGEAKDYALWFFGQCLSGCQPRGNIPIAANITFLEDSLGQYKKKLPIYPSADS